MNASKLASLQIPLAPLQEQDRIVAKLNRLRARSSRARLEHDRIAKLIERYKQAILAKAFSGELTADWRISNPKVKWSHNDARVIAVRATHIFTDAAVLVSGNLQSPWTEMIFPVAG